MRAKSEDAQIDDLERRMIEEYGDRPAATVSAVIARARRRFALSAVRDFVLLLIERRSRRKLDATTWVSAPENILV